MKCPICDKYELISQSLEDSQGKEPDLFCPEIIKMPNGKILNHYREYPFYQQIRMIVLPYRILTLTKDNVSKVSIKSQYKNGEHYFKTLLTVPTLHPDGQSTLLNRIKLLLLLS